MMKRRVLMLVIGVLASSGDLSRAGQAEVARFWREYPVASERLEERLGRMKGSCRIRFQAGPKAKPQLKDAKFAADGGSIKVELLEDRRGSLVYCVGSGSGFILGRGAKSTSYSIRGLDDRRIRAEFASEFGRFLHAPFSNNGMSLSKITKLPSFHLVSVEPITGDGAGLLVLRYELGPKPADRETLILDPDHGWILRSGKSELGRFPGATLEFKADYDFGSPQFPVPRSVEFVELSRAKAKCDFQDIAFEPTPPSAFTLASYGLADFGGTFSGKSSPNGTALWLAGLAGAGIILALGLKRLAERARAS